MLVLNRLAITAFILFFYRFKVFAAKVAVIVPIEHEAMIQIVSGIHEALQNTNTELIIKNAHGDINIMSAIIKQIQEEEDIKIVMPIGSSTSQMVFANINNKAIICVAAKPYKSVNSLSTGVNDEIPITTLIQKLPTLRNISVIYSANEKAMPEINELKNHANLHGLILHLSMIQNLTDLPSVVNSAPDDIDSFLILKDHLVVSGINIIVKEAIKRNVPLIASDEGSVIHGATIAMGVPEKDIGYESGRIAKMILDGVKPIDIPYRNMESLVLFINNIAFTKQKILTREMLKDLKLNEKEVQVGRK